MSEFIHLHNHSHFSILDGAATIDALVGAAVENKMPAVALTDHGVMNGVIEFYIKAKEANIKPILGSEFYIAPHGTDRKDKTSRIQGKGEGNGRGIYNHIVLLAKNEIGYKNLVQLSSIGFTEGFYYKPRIDFEILKKYSEGIVCLSACPVGVIADYLVLGNYDKAYEVCKDYKELFGDDFYLEVQNHNLDVEKPILTHLPKMAKQFGLKLIATNDNHYIRKEHALAHNVLLMIPDASSSGTQLDYHKLKYGTDQIYFKSADEMQKLFRDMPEAISSTLEVADKCNVVFDLKKNYLPNFPLPPEAGNITLDAYLTQLANKGARKLYPDFSQQVESRLQNELNVINQMGYAGYFLIVKDFIDYARSQHITVGPGRGSAAGSLVAFALGITTIEPLKYDLLFERFLNSERVSMPDIDIDFTDTKRDMVIQYVKQKYGEHAVSQIITFNTLQSRAVLKDVGRVLGIPLATVDEVTKQIPTIQGNVMPLEEAYKEIPKLKELRKNTDEKIKSWLDISLTLEGMNRTGGTHAAGVVIAPGPITDYAPVTKSQQADLMTQYCMSDLEKIGLLKMDFLGIRTLRAIENALKMIEENHNVIVDLEKISDSDQKVFEIFSKGNCVGVFQFESSGMQDALRRLKPTQFTDLVAMNALYRPGPMEMIPAFIDRKLGKIKFEYLHPKLESILKETFGIIVYQEQVTRMASDFAGFSLAKADLLRRAMGKKDKALMLKQRKEFIAGAIANGYAEKLANEIFELIEKFASYGFNKSHSVAYAKVAYQTAYLKTYFPAEFMAATLSTELHDNTRIGILIEDCRKHDIAVLAPEVNESSSDFVVTKEKILFGLSAIKGVGTNAVDNIIKSRESGGKFKNIFDFTSRVNLRLVNKRTMEGLIQAGAFDALHNNRAQLFSAIERITIYGQGMQESKQQGQSGLFEMTHTEHSETTLPTLPNVLQWTESEKLAREKQVLGFFVSGHPLQNYHLEIESFATTTLIKLDEIKHGEPIRVCGIISEIKKKTDKRGGMMAFISLEDINSKRECIVFAKVFEKNAPFVQEGKMVMVIGKNDMGGEIAKIIAEEFMPIENVMQKFARAVKLSIDVHTLNENNIYSLKQMLENSKGTCNCYIDVFGFPEGETKLFKSEKYNVTPSKDLMQFLQNTFGKDAVSIMKQ